MRFPQAWAEIAKQNNILKVAIIGVSVSAAIALLISLKFAFKDPIIIDRACYSAVALATSRQEPTKEEVESFIKIAITQRFDTDAVVQSDLISLEELGNRSTEQDELKRRNIRQRVMVNSVTLKNDAYVVESDRVLAVGQLRSALSFPIVVKIQRADRTLSNPYGLVLLRVSAVNQEVKK